MPSPVLRPRLALWLVSFLGALLVGLSACQDPSNVGIGLIDDERSNPNLRVVNADSVFTVSSTLRTGGFTADGTPVQTRFLAGRVVDPVLGNARATAYIDVRLPPGTQRIPEGSLIEFAELYLVRDYVYGDTLATTPLEVREVTTQWTPVGLPADTVLATGPLLATAQLRARGDTTLVIPLPDSWVAERDSVLQSPNVSSLFEGFELRTPAGASGAVVGFNARSSALRLRVVGDTTVYSYPLAEVYTALSRDAPATPPPGVVLVRQGAPEALGFTFDLEPLRGIPLARATLRFSLDRSAVPSAGSFVRPLATEALLVGVREDDSRLTLGQVTIPASGDGATLPSLQFTTTLQGQLLGQAPFKRYELSLPASPLSLDVLPVVRAVRPDAAPPRLVLTVVGQQT
ncbi:MAG: hypothetical protein ACK41D_03255 [Rubricoccaceae bacterium]